MKKNIIITLVCMFVLSTLTGCSWGGMTQGSMHSANKVNYLPRPVYGLDGEVRCWLLPFQKYYSDPTPLGISTYTEVDTAGCYGWVP
jgi:hypothetical protein